jgi:hypothetical protein|eukprot:COSAG06_NODE_2317_length_7093_cov_3.472262_4_plen_117_part_00
MLCRAERCVCGYVCGGVQKEDKEAGGREREKERRRAAALAAATTTSDSGTGMGRSATQLSLSPERAQQLLTGVQQRIAKNQSLLQQASRTPTATATPDHRPPFLLLMLASAHGKHA